MSRESSKENFMPVGTQKKSVKSYIRWFDGVWERVASRYGCDVKKTFDGRIFVKHQIFVKYLLVGERFGVWERVANR